MLIISLQRSIHSQISFMLLSRLRLVISFLMNLLLRVHQYRLDIFNANRVEAPLDSAKDNASYQCKERRKA